MELVIKGFATKLDADLIGQLLPTSPLRAVQVLKNSIQALLKSGADSLRSVELMTESAYKCYTLRQSGTLQFLSPVFTSLDSQGLQPVNFVDKSKCSDTKGLLAGNSCHNVYYQTLSDMDFSNLPNQLLPPTYRCNGYVDIFRRSNVLVGKPWGQVLGFITDSVIEIDTIEQLRYAEWVTGGVQATTKGSRVGIG